MPSREEIIRLLSTATTDERQWFTRGYGSVVPRHDMEFRNRSADKTTDSHGVHEGRRVTWLAQDGSIPVLPYYTGDSAHYGHLERSLNTALGAVANRLKLPGQEQQEQSAEFKERRLIVAGPMFEVALTSVVSGPDYPDMPEIVEFLRQYLYDAGDREILDDETLGTIADNMVAITASNIEKALEKVR